MTISETITPGQDNPTVGGVELHPLGGDGFISPQSVYHVEFEQTGDASGNYNEMVVVLDRRYVSLVSLVQGVLHYTGAADYGIQWQLEESAISKMVAAGIARDVAGSGSMENVLSWSPPPFLVAQTTSGWPFIRQRAPNRDGERAQMYLHVFNFDRNSRTQVPIEVMSRCLVRSENLVGGL